MSRRNCSRDSHRLRLILDLDFLAPLISQGCNNRPFHDTWKDYHVKRDSNSYNSCRELWNWYLPLNTPLKKIAIWLRNNKTESEMYHQKQQKYHMNRRNCSRVSHRLRVILDLDFLAPLISQGCNNRPYRDTWKEYYVKKDSKSYNTCRELWNWYLPLKTPLKKIATWLRNIRQ